MNFVLLSGYISYGPELRRTDSGKAVCNFNLAVRRTKEATDFLPITCWGTTAEFVMNNFHKGSRIEVSGRLRHRTWEDSGGTKHYTVEIHASNVEFGERAPKTAEPPTGAGTEEFADLSAEEDNELPY